ncbi:hypothetical protein [Escherichia coli]|uniref:hypothetical protein n=1 Tax=Escherichia coli TaxID=562 RepID=UPI00388D4B16
MKEASDQGSIGTEATRAGILEKLAANTGLVSIEKRKAIRNWSGKRQNKVRSFEPPYLLKS